MFSVGSSMNTATEITTNLDVLINLSRTVSITVDEMRTYFDSMSSWCAENLDENSWHFSNLIKVKDYKENEMIFARVAVFSREEDALAFKIKFGIWDDPRENKS